MTLPSLLLQRAAQHPNRVALRQKTLGRWQETSWAQYAVRAAAVGGGLRAIGVAAGDCVAIASENRPEWLLADLGAQGIGAVSVGVNPDAAASDVKDALRASKCAVVVVEDEQQLDKVLAVRGKGRTLKHIVVIDTRGVRDLDDPMVMTFAELEKLGGAQPVDGWADASQTHLADPTDDDVLSYLPLSDAIGRSVSLTDALNEGYVVNFGAAGESLAVDLRELQPTRLQAEPRLWAEMAALVETRMSNASRIKRLVYRAGMKRGRRNRIAGAVFWLLLFRSLREKLGLSRVRVAITNGAVAPDVRDFFNAIGVPLTELTDA